jgi:hypothetical protein
MRRTVHRVAVVLTVACGLTACGPAFRLTLSTTSSTEPLRAKPPGCEFRVVNIPPQGPYEEIGTLTRASWATNDPVAFKNAVAGDVCRIGGDVVVTEVNGDGIYVRGTVLRKVGPPAGPAANVAPGAAGLIRP